MKTLKQYFAFKRLKNFVTVDVRPTANTLLLYLKMDPDSIDLEDGFTRNVRKIGHWGTGDLEITLRAPDDLKKAMPLIEESYQAS